MEAPRKENLSHHSSHTEGTANFWRLEGSYWQDGLEQAFSNSKMEQTNDNPWQDM
jgi:hypothetical protein